MSFFCYSVMLGLLRRMSSAVSQSRGKNRAQGGGENIRSRAAASSTSRWAPYSRAVAVGATLCALALLSLVRHPAADPRRGAGEGSANGRTR